MSAQKVAINFAKLPGAAAAPMICRNALTRSYMLPLTTLLSRSLLGAAALRHCHAKFKIQYRGIGNVGVRTMEYDSAFALAFTR